MREEEVGKILETALVVKEQHEIAFYGDRVIAIKVEDGGIYIPIRPICDLMGLSWTGQYDRLQRDEVLSEEIAVIRVTRTTDGATATQTNSMTCLPLDMLNGWLFGINTRRVKASVRPKLLQYQKECYRVLADAFMGDRVTARPDDDLMESQTPAAIAYRNAMAVANLARQQYYIEQRLDSAETRINAIEARLSDPKRLLTSDQARRVADGVQTIAHELGKRSGRNEYAGVYNELYRRFEVPDYRSLPAAQFDPCMDWLRQWYESLTASNVPF
jgi:hypothetical protein